MKTLQLLLNIVVISLLAAGCSTNSLAENLGAQSKILSTRQRFVAIAVASRELMGKAEALAPNLARNLGMYAVVPEDRLSELPERFARESEVVSYIKLRPWSVVYGDQLARMWPGVSVEAWPSEADAATLRELLHDTNGEVRSLALEALGALGLPEDVKRIAELLEDEAPGALVLAWSEQASSMPWFPLEANPLRPERTWHARKVSTYAREALKLMTGHRFDGKDPEKVAFADWWKTHDRGKESLWYWQQRLIREERAVVMIERKEGEGNHDFAVRREAISSAARTVRHKSTVAEIQTLPWETQTKIFLLTQKNPCDVNIMGAANPFFPEGMQLMISPGRLMELIKGTNLWPEIADVECGRQLILIRLARMADQLTCGYGAPFFYTEALVKQIETELGRESRTATVLVSRLKLPATSRQLDDPTYREGYLRRALAESRDGYQREIIAAEMVRQNLDAQWPVLETVFYTEKRYEGSDARIGILKALGEEPHTKRKLQVLAGLIVDARNETLLTQVAERMGQDLYRHYAVESLNALAGHEVVSYVVLQDLGIPERSAQALEKFRRIAEDASQGNGKKFNH